MIRGKDAKALQEEINMLKEQLVDYESEKKILVANAKKYEARAKYTLDKFNEIKEKEMQLI